VDPLVVDPPAGVSSGIGSPSPSPPRTFHREVPEEGPQVLFVLARERWREPLGGPGLADDLTGVAFGDPEPFRE